MRPIPNVLYEEKNRAIERLYEYHVKVEHIPSNKALPNHVVDFSANEKEDEVTLYVANAPEGSFSLDERIDYVHVIDFVTGRKSINKDILVPAKAGATDLGIPVDLNNRIIYLYGDTFAGNDCNDGLWNSNFIAYSSRRDFSNGIHFDGVIKDDQGIIKPIKQGKHDRDKEENLDISLHKEVTKIPTGGILVGDYVYIYMMQVRHWGKAGEWFVSENQAYKAHKDNLNNFQEVETLRFDETPYYRLGQIYPFDNPFDKENIYFLSIPGGRFGKLSLLRVKREKIEDKHAYELCIGLDKWGLLDEHINDEYFILKGPASEPSIMYNEYLGGWLISSLSSKGMCFYLKKNLTDDKEEEILILTHKEVASHYGGFLHPSLSEYHGQKVYLQVSQWSPIYNTSLIEIVFKKKEG